MIREWRVAGLVLMDGGGGVLCVSIWSSLSDVRGCGCNNNLLSGTYD